MSNPPPSAPQPLPVLTPEVVADDELLAMAVDDLVGADLDARVRMQEVFVYAEALRATLDENTWRTFLRYDEIANARFSELLLAASRWAFNEGRRHPMVPFR